MKTLLFAMLVSASFAIAQNDQSATASSGNETNNKGQVTVQGCLSRSNGDYTLIKQNPGNMYELQASGKIKLRHYVGQRVEVVGEESPSMSTSSDTAMRAGSASPVTITVTSIRMIAKECSAH